ncbi:MAG: NTP transferase domain-containing protein [Bacteroidales bacterium]|nr:NTP transferase domain-containing protein [Bacteroidales bacterium]
MNAIILAAGLGTRLRPLTDNTPKALVEVGGKTMLEHQILNLKKAGVSNIVINIHYFGEQIVEFLKRNNNFGLNIKISDERELLLDTGGGIAKAGCLFENDAPILVHNVDIFTNVDLKRVYCEGNKFDVMLVTEKPRSNRVLYFTNNQLCGWRNKATNETLLTDEKYIPNANNERAFMGIHVLNAKTIRLMREYKEAFPLIPFYLNASKSRELNIGEMFCGDDIIRIDAGKPEVLAECKEIIEKFYL